MGFVAVLNVNDKASGRQSSPVLLKKQFDNQSLVLNLSFYIRQDNNNGCTFAVTEQSPQFDSICWHSCLVGQRDSFAVNVAVFALCLASEKYLISVTHKYFLSHPLMFWNIRVS